MDAAPSGVKRSADGRSLKTPVEQIYAFLLTVAVLMLMAGVVTIFLSGEQRRLGPELKGAWRKRLRVVGSVTVPGTPWRR